MRFAQDAAEILNDGGERAQAAGFLCRGERVKGGDGLVRGVEELAVHGLHDGAGAVPWGELGADLIFGNHVGHGFRDGVGRADEGGDGGPAVIHVVQGLIGGEAAVAGDQGEGDVALNREDLDGLAQAGFGDGVEQLSRGVGRVVGAVTGQGVFVDVMEREMGDVVHGRPCPVGLRRLGYLSVVNVP